MAEQCTASMVKVAIAQLLHQTGYERAQDSACTLLADLFIRYLGFVAATASEYSNIAGRSIAQFEDAARAFEDLRVQPDALMDFCKGWMSHIDNKSKVQQVFDRMDSIVAGVSKADTSQSAELPVVAPDGQVFTIKPGQFPLNVDDLRTSETDLEVSNTSEPTQTSDDSMRPSWLPFHLPPLPTGENDVANCSTSSKDGNTAYGDGSFQDALRIEERNGLESSQDATLRKRKRTSYEELLSFTQSALAAQAFDLPKRPPSRIHSGKPLVAPRSKKLFEQAMIGTTRAQHRTNQPQVPSKGFLPLIQGRRRRAQAAHDDTMFGSNSEKGILDDVLALALPNLPGLLGGQKPPREARKPPPVTLSIPTKVKASGGSGKKSRSASIREEPTGFSIGRSSAETPHRPSISVAPETPKIKLKFNLGGSNAQASASPLTAGIVGDANMSSGHS
ncbi:hypothetical protein BC832DRAFT_79518 [Gaertneriomyces semiglobifer]|nr:hypothetical protein BC832DRAFT_79518 [Gaertneriomyces semiglobifer]